MKAKVNPPFFEVGVKNYIYGDAVLELAKAADRAAVKYDIDVIFLAPYVDIRRICENTERLLVFAPYMDTLRPGRGMVDELDMLSFVCADTVEEARAIAHLGPDIMNPEPTELIGTGSGSSDEFVLESIRAVKDIYEDILVEQAAGIRTGEQVYKNIMLGADGVGAASGIVCARDPLAMVEEMVSSVRKAYQDREKGEK